MGRNYIICNIALHPENKLFKLADIVLSFRDLSEGKLDLLSEVNYHSAAEGFVKYVLTTF